jgi:D-beta-D-heptose 7-phosphate kinase/D-beta-D-heptose 1-phosphate adenosyltransferase
MKIIVVNGTFDVIHPGHIALLNYAKSLGEYLIVAIDTDRRVKQLKGTHRPINTQDERKLLLENLKAVDEVRLFQNTQELLNIYKLSSVIVKGSDHKDTPDSLSQTQNCNVIYFNRINEYSSTKKIQDIINRG